MPRVTLIWAAPYKVLHIRKSLIYFLLVGSTFLFLLTFTFGAWVVGTYGNLKGMENDYAELRTSLRNPAGDLVRMLQAKEKDIAFRDQELIKKDATLQELTLEIERARQELQEIREMEGKIRQFLGLGEPAEPEMFSHQGGFGGLLVDIRQGDFTEAIEEALRDSSLRYAFLRSGLAEILEQLETRRETFLQVPSILPARGDDLWISSSFGWRPNPFGRGREFHNGLDIAGKHRTPIIAPADGTVLVTGEDRTMGKYVQLRHTDDLETVYLHLHAIKVEQGSAVKRGDTIGLMGSTGRSTGTHLHYSVIVEGEHVDPIDYIWDRSASSLRLAANKR